MNAIGFSGFLNGNVLSMTDVCHVVFNFCVAIFAFISASRPRADVAYCIHALARRLAKTHNWAVSVFHSKLTRCNLMCESITICDASDSYILMFNFSFVGVGCFKNTSGDSSCFA